MLGTGHCIPVRWLHPCPLQQCQHLLQGRPIDSARQKEIDDRLGKCQAGEKLTCKWCAERPRREGGGGGFQPAHLWMQGEAACVVCPRDSSAAPPHARERGKSSSLLPPPLTKTSLPSHLMLLPWCWAVLERGKRAKTAACCQRNWERCNYFPSLSLAAFLLLSLGH